MCPTKGWKRVSVIFFNLGNQELAFEPWINSVPVKMKWNVKITGETHYFPTSFESSAAEAQPFLFLNMLGRKRLKLGQTSEGAGRIWKWEKMGLQSRVLSLYRARKRVEVAKEEMHRKRLCNCSQCIKILPIKNHQSSQMLHTGPLNACLADCLCWRHPHLSSFDRVTAGSYRWRPSASCSHLPWQWDLGRKLA